MLLVASNLFMTFAWRQSTTFALDEAPSLAEARHGQAAAMRARWRRPWATAPPAVVLTSDPDDLEWLLQHDRLVSVRPV